MIKKTKKLLTHKKYKTMISNYSYLTFINIANKFLPLLVVPYIVHTVGVEKFGIIVFAASIMQYFHLMTRYSFELTATKYISQNRDDNEKISSYFWTIMSSSLFLFLIGAVIFSALLLTVGKFNAETEVFLYSFLFVFANALIPLWFFQGMEDMKYIAIFDVVSRLFYTVAIFIFVKSEADYVLVPLLNSLSFLFVGIYAMWFIVKKYSITFTIPLFSRVKEILIEGHHIFISNISDIFYTTTNTVLLGFLVDYKAVGIYSLAYTLFGAYSKIIKTYTTVIYPHLAQYTEDMKKLCVNARKFLNLYVIILFVSALFLYMISDFAIGLLFGEGHAQSVLVLKVLAVGFLLEPLGGFFTRYLALKSEYKMIKSITFKTMIANFIIIIPMILIYKELGVAISFLLLGIVQVYLNVKENREIIDCSQSKRGEVA